MENKTKTWKRIRGQKHNEVSHMQNRDTAMLGHHCRGHLSSWRRHYSYNSWGKLNKKVVACHCEHVDKQSPKCGWKIPSLLRILCLQLFSDKCRYPNDTTGVHLGNHFRTERECNNEVGNKCDVGQVRLSLKRLWRVDADRNETDESKWT